MFYIIRLPIFRRPSASRPKVKERNICFVVADHSQGHFESNSLHHTVFIRPRNHNLRKLDDVEEEVSTYVVHDDVGYVT